MKPTRLALLVVSLLANAALGAWLLLPPSASPLPAKSAALVAPPDAAPVAVDPLTQPLTAVTWPALAGLSDADYVARLRAEGMPPELVSAMLRSRITARYAERLKVFRAQDKDEYWRRTPMRPDDHLSLEERKARRAINSEIDAEMKAALGDGPEAVPGYERARRALVYGPLSSEKLTQVEALLSDYSELSASLRDRMQGITLPEDRAQLRLLERERRADLEATLTPAELIEYDLRSSSAAFTVRNEIAYFGATEEEYRALTLLRLNFDRQFGTSYLTDEEQAKKRAAEGQLLEQARTVLSPERYEEYAVVTHNEFRNTVRDLARFNFDVAVAKDVFSVRQNITTRAAAINANPLYSPEQRSAELAALYREASTTLSTKLGAKAYEAFEGYSGGGNWVRKLKPAAPKATGPGGNEQ